MLDSQYTFDDEFEDALAAVEASGLPLRIRSWTAREDAAIAEGWMRLFLHGPRVRGEYRLFELSLGNERYIDVVAPNVRPVAPIMVDDALIGEVRPYRVYSYIALQHYVLADGMIEAFTSALTLSQDAEFIRSYDERTESQRREALTDFMRSRSQLMIAAYRDEIDTRQRDLIVHQDNIVGIIRTIQAKQQLLDAMLLIQTQETGDTILREWDQIAAHPRVIRCTFENSKVIVTTTDDIRMTRDDTGDSRWLGSFKITFELSMMAIRIENLSTRRGGRDHPHVVDGRPCFGGHQEAFMELLGRGELYTVFELLLQYLETLNLRDEYGRYGAYWFDLPDERPLEVAEAA